MSKLAAGDLCFIFGHSSGELQVLAWEIQALLAGKKTSGNFISEDVEDYLISNT